MKQLLRLGAFILDSLLISIIAILIVRIPFINPNLEKITTLTEEIIVIQEQYQKFPEELKKLTKDSLITEKEQADLNSTHAEYPQFLKSLKVNEELNDKDIEKMQNAYNKDYRNVYNNRAYKIQKYSIISGIVSSILMILYFGIFQYFFKGQTLFKKLFHLRVVDNTDNTKKVPLWKYILRAILVCELIFTILDIILILSLGKGAYIATNGWIVQLQRIYEAVFIIVMILRDDTRGIQDLLFNTRVNRYDKFDNIVLDKPLFGEIEENADIKESKEDKNAHKGSRKTHKNISKDTD